MKNLRRAFCATACATALATTAGLAWSQPAPAPAAAPEYKPAEGQPGKDVMWVPTSQVLVDRMLAMAKVTPKDHVVDLGSGDGRLVITAAQRGATGHGIEYNPNLVELSKRSADAAGVSARATFEKADIFVSDFSKATVVTMFLLPELNARLRPILLNMKPGTRIVSNSFDMGEWKADQTQRATEGCRTYCDAFQWTVPARVDGIWQLGGGKELVLAQNFQMLEGSLRDASTATEISSAKMEGNTIRFSVDHVSYTGEFDGRQLKGTTDKGANWSATRVAR